MSSPQSPVLSPRALNRATLARQLLLERAARRPLDVVELLVGLQAQAPNAPYVALWSRLEPFDHAELGRAVAERAAVRFGGMRATIHLATARDAPLLRAATQVVLERMSASSTFARDVAGVDLDALLAAGRELVEQEPRTRAQLAPLLGERFPAYDGSSLAYVFTFLMPLAQVPPRGVWGERGPIAWTTLDSWLGAPLPPPLAAGAPDLDALVLRYLGAFGPASVMDAQTWSGLTRLKLVFERLRERLLTFRDERGVELFDLPDAPRPDADTPAPPRFLPEFDNLLLSHADRTRVVPAGRRVPIPAGNGGRTGTVLIDGEMRAQWTLARERRDDAATLTVAPYEQLARSERDAVEEEARRLAAFLGAPAASVVLS